MPCDERYRAWATRRVPPAATAPPGTRRAVFVRVSRCPARPGFRELHFDVEGTAWSWCFPAAAEPGGRGAWPRARGVVFRPGPHGLMAEAAADQGGSPPRRAGLDLAVASGLVMSGAAVFVHDLLTGPAAAAEGRAAEASRPGPPPVMAAGLPPPGEAR